MNVFLLHPDHEVSAQLLAEHDPVRARKQLLECCQLLATFDYLLYEKTTLRRKNGDPYKCAHPHHPITRHMLCSPAQVALVYDVADSLAKMFPGHACSTTLRLWFKTSSGDGTTLIACRKGFTPVLCNNRAEYASLMMDYMVQRKNFNTNKESSSNDLHVSKELDAPLDAASSR